MVLNWAEGTFAFKDTFVDKVLAAAPDTPGLVFEDLQYVAGLANWAAHLSRTPLVRFHNLFSTLSQASRPGGGGASLPPLSPAALAEWALVRQLITQSYPIAPAALPLSPLVVYTDASDSLGGAVIYSPEAPPSMMQWTWHLAERHHINEKELAAVYHTMADLQLKDATVSIP